MVAIVEQSSRRGNRDRPKLVEVGEIFVVRAVAQLRVGDAPDEHDEDRRDTDRERHDPPSHRSGVLRCEYARTESNTIAPAIALSSTLHTNSCDSGVKRPRSPSMNSKKM